MSLARHLCVFIALFFTVTFAMNCDFSEDKSCLNVLDSEASEKPKCFCTNLCPVSLPQLKRNCTSGKVSVQGVVALGGHFETLILMKHFFYY